MSNYLVHYGTKGQKWGNRKYQYEDGSLTPEGKIHYGYGDGTGTGPHQDAAEYRSSRKDQRAVAKERELDSKNSYMMSDEDLQYRIGRLEKEKRLRELTESEVMPGKAEARKVFRDVGRQTLTNVGTRMLTGAVSYGGKMGGTLIGNWLSSKGGGYETAGTIVKELGEAMWNGGPKK